MAEGRGYGRGDSRREGGGDWEEIRQGSLHMKLWTLKYGEALDHESHLYHVESVAVNIVLERGSADANEVLDSVFMADAWI